MEPNNEPNNFPTPVTDNGKTAGIISYFTIIGWLVAFFAMHKDNKTEIGSYQLRQTLLLHIIMLGFYIIWEAIFISLLFSSGVWFALTLNWIVRIGLFVIWVVGLIGAVNGEKKPMPLIGEKAQTMFPGI